MEMCERMGWRRFGGLGGRGGSCWRAKRGVSIRGGPSTCRYHGRDASLVFEASSGLASASWLIEICGSVLSCPRLSALCM